VICTSIEEANSNEGNTGRFEGRATGMFFSFDMQIKTGETI
jgi:hypothetical protein